jgi:chromosome segregation ATPase
MQNISELERRITTALERIGRGLEGLSAATAPEPAAVDAALPLDLAANSEVAQLTEALDEERMANAQLNERLRVLAEQAEHRKAKIAAKVAELTDHIASQAAELATLRETVTRLSDELAASRASAQHRVVELAPDTAALQTELQALRDARATEAADLADIVAALNPLIEEASANA